MLFLTTAATRCEQFAPRPRPGVSLAQSPSRYL